MEQIEMSLNFRWNFRKIFLNEINIIMNLFIV